MQNLRPWLLTLFLFVWVSPSTDSRQAPSRDSEVSIVFLSRRVDCQLLRYVGANPQNGADPLTQLSHLCRETKRSHDVVSMLEDSSNVAEIFDALKLVEQAECDGKVGTAF